MQAVEIACRATEPGRERAELVDGLIQIIVAPQARYY